jgi:hypothetical protein
VNHYVTAFFLSMLVCSAALLAGCGSSNNAAAPVRAAMTANPAVIITFDGERHMCVVALSSEAQGSFVPCTDVVPFIRDELRLANGSIYDTRTIATFDPAEMAKTTQKLNDAGYRFNGGH